MEVMALWYQGIMMYERIKAVAEPAVVLRVETETVAKAQTQPLRFHIHGRHGSSIIMLPERDMQQDLLREESEEAVRPVLRTGQHG